MCGSTPLTSIASEAGVREMCYRASKLNKPNKQREKPQRQMSKDKPGLLSFKGVFIYIFSSKASLSREYIQHAFTTKRMTKRRRESNFLADTFFMKLGAYREMCKSPTCFLVERDSGEREVQRCFLWVKQLHRCLNLSAWGSLLNQLLSVFSQWVEQDLVWGSLLLHASPSVYSL